MEALFCIIIDDFKLTQCDIAERIKVLVNVVLQVYDILLDRKIVIKSSRIICNLILSALIGF